jgi:hypothetical protein
MRAWRAFGSRKVHLSYLGWTLIGLAGLGLARRREGTGALCLAGATGAALSLGPVLLRRGEPLVLAGDKVVPLPYFLVEGWPGFSALTDVYALSMTASLALGLLAASAIDGRRLRWLGVAIALVTAEVLWVSPAAGLQGATSVPRSPALSMLADAPEGAVVNFPVIAGRPYLYEQLHHRKPLCGGLERPDGPGAAELWTVAHANAGRDPTWVRTKISTAAKRLGIRYVSIHLDPDAQPDMHHAAIRTMERAFVPLTLSEVPPERTPTIRVLQLW